MYVVLVVTGPWVGSWGMVVGLFIVLICICRVGMINILGYIWSSLVGRRDYIWSVY